MNSLRHIPDLLAMAVAAYANWQLWGWIGARGWVRLAAVGWAAGGFALAIPPLIRIVPNDGLLEWVRGMGIVWALLTTSSWIGFTLLRWAEKRRPAHDPGRRNLLRVARRVVLAAPAAACGYGVFLARDQFQLKAVDIRIRNLPKGLDGFRMVQLTDIHFGPFLGEKDLRYAIGMANETKAHLALVTGDLITLRRDPLDACLGILSSLRADLGVYGCLGNHEVFAGCEDYAARQAARYGMRFLRGTCEQIRLDGASFNLAGVDYQRMGGPYLRGAEKLIRPDRVNVLLCHNPDAFPAAARLGFDLTVAGHTHGGQVTVEILNQYANVARFFTPYVSGLYTETGSSVYVSRGLGTVGAPIRLGAPPEVTLIRLCAG
jgi:predicted MPP superfamily phosphohydrolase